MNAIVVCTTPETRPAVRAVARASVALVPVVSAAALSSASSELVASRLRGTVRLIAY